MARRSCRIRYIDLFAGCGGLSEGFEAQGAFSGVAHVEWEAAPALTLENRLRKKWEYRDADRRVICADIQDTAAICVGHGLDSLVSAAGSLDLVIGGPPCQAYSLAGRIRDENGMRNDYRNFLFESYLAIVARYRPVAVLFENVPGMLSAKPGGVNIRDRIAASFRAVGYVVQPDISDCVLNAADYGVPQRRERVIIMGIRSDMKNAAELVKSFYQTARNLRLGRTVTVSEAIGHLPRLMPLRTAQRRDGRLQSHEVGATSVADHVSRFHNVRDQRIFRRLARDLMSRRPKLLSAERLKKLYTEETGRTSAVHKYHVLRPDEPSNLIPAHLHKDGLRHIHFDPEQCRSITVREAALLQGFPDDFEFSGSQGANYKMIGNAVPPPFAQALATALQEAVFKYVCGSGAVVKLVKRKRGRSKSHSRQPAKAPS
jgi:DNA-cytosine methyltransferase